MLPIVSGACEAPPGFRVQSARHDKQEDALTVPFFGRMTTRETASCCILILDCCILLDWRHEDSVVALADAVALNCLHSWWSLLPTDRSRGVRLCKRCDGRRWRLKIGWSQENTTFAVCGCVLSTCLWLTHNYGNLHMHAWCCIGGYVLQALRRKKNKGRQRHHTTEANQCEGCEYLMKRREEIESQSFGAPSIDLIDPVGHLGEN